MNRVAILGGRKRSRRDGINGERKTKMRNKERRTD